MIDYSDSDNSQNYNNYQSSDKNQYQHKINSIWKNIKKTKNIEPSDQESYQKYRNKKIHQKQLSGEKYNNNDIQSKLIANLKTKKASQPQTQQKRHYLQQRNDINSSENSKINLKNHNLKTNSDLEQKLQKSKENTNILMKKLIQAEQQIEYLQYELQKQMTQKAQLSIQLQTRNQNFNNQKENRRMNSNKKDHSEAIQSQISIDKYRLRLKVAQKQIQQKNKQFLILQKQIRALNNEIEQWKSKGIQYSNQKTFFKGGQILELNQAYKTIQRLVSLLRSTQQYRLLGNFAQEIKNIHFLSMIPKQIKSQLLNIKINSKTKQKPLCSCTQIKINQRLLWTPLLCYKKMLEMKLKYDSLNENCIEEVLFEMNKLYLSKQQSRVNKLKTFYEGQIDKLKKKSQITYDQILAKKQIQRLKKQLQTSKKKPIRNSCKKSSDPNIEQKLRKINNVPNLQNLRVIGQYEDELKLKQRQVKLLSQRIRLLEGETSSYDKSLYMEGILWIVDKVLEQLDTNGQDIRQFQNKFRSKMNAAYSTQDWIRLFKEFFQSIQELNHSLIQKILNIKQSTINKMNYAKMS